MQPVTFSNLTSKIKPVVVWCSMIQLGFALAAGIMIYFWNKSLLGWIELLASIAVIIFLLTQAFLWYLFLRQPEVKEKYRLRNQIQQGQAELVSAQASLSDILVKKELVQRQLQDEEQAERERFHNLDGALQEQIQHLADAKDQEIKSELSRLQTEYMVNGLRNIPLDPNHVPGIGDLLAEKLMSNGILTAYDVSSESIYKIPGFGEAKTLSLLRWREVEEFKLREAQLSALPSEELAAIEQKYTQQVLDKQSEGKSAQLAHEETMQAIRVKQVAELTAWNEKETSTRLRLTSLTDQQQEAQGQYQQHAGITFVGMLTAAVFTTPMNWSKRFVAMLAPIGYFASGILNIIILIGTLIWSRM